jgi:hypothetical protein
MKHIFSYTNPWLQRIFLKGYTIFRWPFEYFLGQGQKSQFFIQRLIFDFEIFYI